jgi:VWFA-related protein
MVAAAVYAQDPPIFRAKTDVVVVPVTVTDRSGRFVRGLTADQFEISDGGVRRPVTQFTAGRVPVSLGILLDISGSMTQDPKARAAEDARWADTRRALELLVSRLDPRDDVFFAAFAEKVGVAVPWSSEHRQLLQTFDRLRPGGKTALFEAVRLIVPAFQLARHDRKVLLTISDGQDTTVAAEAPPQVTHEPPRQGNRGNLPTSGGVRVEPSGRINPRRESLIIATKEAIARSGASLYAIGIGTRKGAPVDTGTLARLSVDSGGYVEPLRDPSEISVAVARICDDLQSQYVLTFEPAHADGKFHPIFVKVKDGGLRVRARAGYVAAAKQQPNP